MTATEESVIDKRLSEASERLRFFRSKKDSRSVDEELVLIDHLLDKKNSLQTKRLRATV